MKTDKVRVIIDESYRNRLTLICVRHPQKATNDSLINEEIFISKDRDNWIDIELPEAVADYHRFQVLISFDKIWTAKMYPLYGNFRADMFYELEVKVY